MMTKDQGRMNLNDAARRLLGLDPGVHDLEDADPATVAAACMGGLARVRAGSTVEVDIEREVALATLGCQMAGWKVDGMLGSGPARILAQKPRDVFELLDYHEKSDVGVLLVETDKPVAADLSERLEDKCGTPVILGHFTSDSPVGIVNVLARVVEVAVFRLRSLDYDVRLIRKARGTVPLTKECAEDAFCATNDALINHGEVELWVDAWDERFDLCSSSACGCPFRELLDAVGGDLYAIDHDVFAPARLNVHVDDG